MSREASMCCCHSLRSSGFCACTSTYHSKRQQVPLPCDPHLTFPCLLLSTCYTPHWPAFVDAASGFTLSHGQYHLCVRAAAAGLFAFGLRPGDVALLLSPNSIFSPVLILSTIHAGGIITLANPLNTPAEIARQVSDFGAKFVYTTNSLLHKLQDCAPMPVVLLPGQGYTQAFGNHVQTVAFHLQNMAIHPETIDSEFRCHAKAVPALCDLNLESNWPICSTTLSELLHSNRDLLPPMSACQDDVVALLYSSGTTGPSKGVTYTHRNLIALASIFYEQEGGRPMPDRIYLCVLPIFHIFGLGVFACSLPFSGCSIVVMPKYDLQAMLSLIEQYRVTHVPVVPAILAALTRLECIDKYDLSSLKQMICGGAPLEKTVIHAFSARFPGVSIKQGYALTESGGLGAIALTEEEMKVHDSVGLLSSNVEAKIMDIISGRCLPPNQQGELLLRVPTIMQGYLNNPCATAEAIDSEGWLHTGDLCYFDEHGYLYVVDRIKELIKYKGLQVAPSELEAVLLSHPEILDAVVVPAIDEICGQIPVAYVVRSDQSILMEDDIMSFVARKVAPYKKVRRVVFIKEIPRSATGKILRRELISSKL